VVGLPPTIPLIIKPWSMKDTLQNEYRTNNLKNLQTEAAAAALLTLVAR
jgi:hypothetical protein